MSSVAVTEMSEQLSNRFSLSFTCILGHGGETDFTLT